MNIPTRVSWVLGILLVVCLCSLVTVFNSEIRIGGWLLEVVTYCGLATPLVGLVWTLSTAAMLRRRSRPRAALAAECAGIIGVVLFPLWLGWIIFSRMFGTGAG